MNDRRPSPDFSRPAASAVLIVAVLAAIAVGFGGRLDALAAGGGNSASATSRRMRGAHEAAGLPAAGGTSANTVFEAKAARLRDEVRAEPDNPGTHLALARFLHDGHRLQEAIGHYRRALELDPDNATTHYDLAAAYATIDSWEAAAVILRTRLQRAPDDLTARYDLGAVLANAGRSPEARKVWMEALEGAPEGTHRTRIEAALERLAGSDPP